MQWLHKLAHDNIEINPSTIGYDEQEWGPHHGNPSFKPDYWNYGPKGYNQPPMPLPKKLYHATPFPEKIIWSRPNYTR